ncbi:DUF4373 domain-containing protein [Mediterranea massiliensis]|uniref:DUF4373 domain-containing protein n=1 Tax=Mediterranea massiliensis TaxID=1841865 RepID=A0ABS2DYL9_9BACT|nr:DUF4373 domain-containing protein [Mediterranea massiliensis]MBM6734478.1 DUF4373 domain-containing protein [Mediterranea massiliensis]
MSMTYTGILYFPLKVNLPENIAMELVEARFGLKGVAVVIKLLCKIYKENGYYLTWNGEQRALFSVKAGRDVSEEEMQGIVDILVEKGFFDRELYEKQGVLTSAEIQEAWLDATKRRKGRELSSLPYLLEDFRTKLKERERKDSPKEPATETTDDTPDVDISGENADIFRQSRVEQSRVEQSIAGKKEEESAEKVSKQGPPDYALNKRTHNYEGLLLTLQQKRITDPAEVSAILRLSDYGRLGGHVWKVLHSTRWKDINARGKYLIAALAKEKRQGDAT